MKRTWLDNIYCTIKNSNIYHLVHYKDNILSAPIIWHIYIKWGKTMFKAMITYKWLRCLIISLLLNIFIAIYRIIIGIINKEQIILHTKGKFTKNIHHWKYLEKMEVVFDKEDWKVQSKII